MANARKATVCAESRPAGTVTITLIDTNTRRVLQERQLASRCEALTFYRKLGPGFDAHIRNSRYDELILCL
jgi:hypothetical protein